MHLDYLRFLALAALCIVAASCQLKDLIQPVLRTHDGALLAVGDSLVDSAAVGSTAPRVDTINIQNMGDGDLRWSAWVKHASPWLTLQPDTGTAGQSPPLQVGADPTGLAIGVYRDTVIVAAASGTGTQEVPIVFRIHP